MPTIPNVLRAGKPLFRDQVFVTRPNLPDRKKFFRLLGKMLDNKWLTNFGPFHNEFQRRLAPLMGAKYVLPCNNATTGLYAALRALDLKGEVITTPFTFAATVHVITMNGLKPVFCDIDPDTYTIDAAKAEKLITKRTSAILAVNVYGNACDIKALERLSKKYSLPVIYDSAHAFCSRYRGRPIGGFGSAEVFSFHATKFFSTMEGGAVATNDRALYERLRLLINFGILNEETVLSPGINGKMAEANAIAGLVALDDVPRNSARLAALHAAYRSGLAGVPGLKFQRPQPGCAPNLQYMPVEVLPEFGLSRDELHAALKADNVFTRKYFYPPANKYECYRHLPADLPATELVSSRILCLPIYASLKPGDVRAIAGLVKSLHRHSAEARAALARGGAKR